MRPVLDRHCKTRQIQPVFSPVTNGNANLAYFKMRNECTCAMNKKLMHGLKNAIHAIVLFAVAFFYFKIIFANLIMGNEPFRLASLGYIIETVCLYSAIPALFSYLIYKKITMSGFLAGFIVQWIIFLNTNPYPLNQDNKLTIMELIPRQYRPDIQFSLDKLKNSSMQEMNVNFPIIIKPSVCSGRRKNVTIVKSQQALDEYFMKNEHENENASNYMVQNYLSDEYDMEIGVLWEKMPWEKEGKIIEINAQPKYKKNKDELTEQDKQDQRDAFNKKVKTFNHLITDDLDKLFNDISKQLMGFNAGRYDILIKSLNDFQNGDFKILEVNGIWGAQATMSDIPFGSVKWFVRRAVIGLGNILTLQGYTPLTLLIVMFKSYARSIVCGNQLAMFSLYI
jgi:hypothetical protein